MSLCLFATHYYELTDLEMHSAKPDAKQRGPKAKNTRPQGMPDPNPPQLDLFD